MYCRVVLIGRLDRAVDIRNTAQGQPMAMFTIETGGDAPRAWHRIVVWGKLAERCARELDVGSLACIEGVIRTNSYTDREGVKRKATQIQAEKVIKLTGEKLL